MSLEPTSISELNRLARLIQKNLKVPSASFQLARTDKGVLEMRFTKDVEGFELLLDSVPLRTQSIIDDDYNIALKEGIEKIMADPIYAYSGNQATYSVSGSTISAVNAPEGTETVQEGTQNAPISTETVPEKPVKGTKKGKNGNTTSKENSA